MKISLAQQIEEVDYELAQRVKVYPRILAKEPRRRAELDYHFDRMRAALATLQWVSANEAAIRNCIAAAPREGAPQ